MLCLRNICNVFVWRWELAFQIIILPPSPCSGFNNILPRQVPPSSAILFLQFKASARAQKFGNLLTVTTMDRDSINCTGWCESWTSSCTYVFRHYGMCGRRSELLSVKNVYLLNLMSHIESWCSKSIGTENVFHSFELIQAICSVQPTNCCTHSALLQQNHKVRHS